MKITTEIKEAPKPEAKRRYPYIGVSCSDAQCVLFTKQSTGVVVAGGKVGFSAEFWDEHNFRLLNGSIIITQTEE